MAPDPRFDPWSPRPRDESSPGLPPDLLLRPARPDDLEAYVRLKLERDPGAGEGARRAAEATLTRSLEEPEACLLLVAELAGRAVAFGLASRYAAPADGPPHGVPSGYYLLGLLVDRASRRRGIGRVLTLERLAWVSRRARRVYYVANVENRVSIHLHAALGFREVRRGVWLGGAMSPGSVLALYEAMV